MRVSERLKHGFMTWALVFATAVVGFQSRSQGQIVTAIQDTTESTSSETSPANGNQFVDPSEIAAPVDKTGPAKMTLLKARQALAHGDVSTAELMLNSARQYRVDFAALGDSPETVASLIEYQKKLMQMAKNRDRNFNQKAAEFLLQQANTMIAYQDFDSCQMLIEQAQKFPVQFGSGELTPVAMMSKLQTARTSMQDQTNGLADVKAEAMKLMSQAQLAYDQANYDRAAELTAQAKALGVPDSEFAANQMRPWQLELQIQNAMKNSAVVPASFEKTQAKVIQADYDPASDTTKNVQVAAVDTTEATEATATETDTSQSDERIARAPNYNPAPSRGLQLFRSALQALDNQDRDGARDYFQLAWQYRDQLDEATQQSIQDNLANLNDSGSATGQDEINLESDSPEKAMFRKLQRDVFKERASAERALERTPRLALERMTAVRNRVAQSNLSLEDKKPLLTIIDRDINDFQQYIEQNLPEIMNDEANAARMEDVELRRQRRYDTEAQIQKLVEDFNDLMDEGRYAEADAIARQAADLDSGSEISVLLTEKARLAVRVAEMEQLRSDKEDGTYKALRNTERASEPFDDTIPLQFGKDTDRYARSAKMRAEALSRRQYSSESERMIWNKLKNQMVQGEYRGTLFEAIDQLSTQAGINIIFDSIALTAEGIETSRPVDVPIREPISLRSALNVILGTAGLVFIVEDEVIKVTSRDAQRKDVKAKTYYVGDLVTPVKNFRHSLNMNFMTPGNGNALNGFVAQNGFGGNGAPLAVQNNQMGGAMHPIGMAQQSASQQMVMGQQLPNAAPFGRGFGFGGYGGGPVQTGTPQFNSIGPPTLGGITAADFEPLIDLIKTTIDPESWDDSNGDGTIQSFVPNLSLIVSQTQAVQDQIQDLLEKLRELNDVQIVIEVRFITLADSFFERIGVDFDFRLNDFSGLNSAAIPDETNPPAVVGRDPVPENFTPTQDLDVAFLQNSFASSIPQFGGFDIGTAANFGFAILSDIEVFFLIQASKGDTRSNIMQAPTVTMFNGQSASVSDGAARPFVTSVIPVVGDFAVAQQPVITLIPEGASLNVQAVVSNDRKSVRMTLVPFFSQIQDVETFTFDGSSTTRRETNANLLDDLLDGIDGSDDEDDTDNDTVTLEESTQGVTIQLPVVGFTTVNTVVSVPDGGTVMMGGIKRMAEGRTERGVPFLSNVPYINRLFKNVGIGRDTTNIMMMVTPRIIIQEEEERAQVGSLGGN